MALKPVKTVDENGEIKVDLVDTNKPGKDLSGFSLPAPIMQRAGEVYKEDAENKKISNEKYQGLPESMRPRLSTQKGTRKGGARAPGLLLNPFNRDGHRSELILNIIKKGGSDLVDSYDPATGKYGLLKESDRLGGGIIDDDITKRLVLQQDKGRKETTEFKNLTKEQRDAVGTLTRTEDVIEGAAADTKLKDTTTRIRKMDQGQTLLDDYTRIELNGKAPTQQQLEMLETHVKQLQPTQLREADTHRQKGELQESNISINEDTLADQQEQTKNTHEINTGTLDLAKDKETRQIKQQEFENEDKIAYRNYQSQEADKLRVFTATENAARRSAEMEINLLGREDTREQRAYDRRRDERQDRQMMIMQMMKGLQNLGSAFAL